MGMIAATKTCFGKYITFSGRASRAEYWWFYLVVVLVSLVAGLVDFALFGSTSTAVVTDGDGEVVAGAIRASSPQPLTSLWGLVVFVPLLAAGWRRAHDSGTPGWHILLPGIAALIGLFGLLLGVAGFGLLETTGANPDKLTGAAAILGVTGMLVLAAAVIGLTIYKIIVLVRRSETGTNQYGPAPEA